MNQKVLKTLEFTKIIEILAEKADSEPGKIMCRELLPSVIPEEIAQNQAETRDALGRLFKNGGTSATLTWDLQSKLWKSEVPCPLQN